MLGLQLLTIQDFLFKDISYEIYNSFIKEDRYIFLINGLGVTLLITAIALGIGTVLGLLTALLRIKRIPLLSSIANGYVSIIRGTPLTVQLVVIYFVILASLNNAMVSACIAFGLNSGAYVSEIFRGGILAVDKGQMEAGRSLGLSYGKTMLHIIIPQSIKNILPAMGNEVIVLLKETSIAGYIALSDLTFAAQSIKSLTAKIAAPILIVAYIYFIITLFITRLLSLLERSLRSSD